MNMMHLTLHEVIAHCCTGTSSRLRQGPESLWFKRSQDVWSFLYSRLSTNMSALSCLFWCGEMDPHLPRLKQFTMLVKKKTQQTAAENNTWLLYIIIIINIIMQSWLLSRMVLNKPVNVQKAQPSTEVHSHQATSKRNGVWGSSV